MTALHVSLPQIAACALLSIVFIAWSVHLARRRGRWLLTVGPLATATLFGALTQWPKAEAEPPPTAGAADPASAGTTPVEATPSPLTAPPSRDAPPPVEAPARVEPTPLGPPSVVILRGQWPAEDSAVVASVLAQVLSRVPAAGGGVLELEGTGRALRPSARGLQQYAIAATWTLRPAPDADVLAGSGLGEVLGIGASPDQARREAAISAARAIAGTLRASLPAPRSTAGEPSPSF